MEYVSELGQFAGVKKIAFAHHDPGRTDDELDQIVESVRKDLRKTESPMEVFAAADGQMVELEVPGAAGPAVPGKKTYVHSAAAPAMKDVSVIIGISDDGPGMTPENVAKIFEPYFTTKAKGTGLGLAIVKHNTEIYGGTVSVESELGKGTRFTIRLPAKTFMRIRK